MSKKKPNHNYKEELGCVPKLLVECYQKTSNLIQKIKHITCILSEKIKQTSRQLRTIPNVDIDHNDMHSWNFEIGGQRAYLGSNLNALMENKCKTISCMTQFKARSINIYQVWQLEINNEKGISCMLGSYQCPTYICMN